MSFEPSAKSYTHLSAIAQNTRCLSTETVKPWFERVLRQVIPAAPGRAAQAAELVVFPYASTFAFGFRTVSVTSIALALAALGER